MPAFDKVNWRRLIAERVPHVVVSAGITVSRSEYDALISSGRLGLVGDADLLAVLRTIAYEAPHGATYHAIADGTRSRFLQAELEFELGDAAMAKRLFRDLWRDCDEDLVPLREEIRERRDGLASVRE